MFQSAAMNFSLWMLLLIFLNILQSVIALRLKLKLLSLPVKCWNVEFLLDSELILIPKRFPPAKDTDHLCYQLDFNMKHLPLLKNFATSKGEKGGQIPKRMKKHMFKVNSVCLPSSVFSFSVYQLCAGNTLMSATAVGDTRTISWFKPKSCVALDLPPLLQISAASEPVSHTYGKIAAGVAVANFIFLPTAQHTSPLRYECSRNCKSRYSTRHFWLYHRNYCWVFSLHILTQHTTYSPQVSCLLSSNFLFF